MRLDNANFAAKNSATTKRPRYVVRISFDDDDTDLLYLTSHSDTETPDGATVIYNVIQTKGLSGVSQKIDPRKGTSTIGSFSFKIVDDNAQISEKLRDKLNAGFGLRHKSIVVYLGYQDLIWVEYTRILTFIVDQRSTMDGSYTFDCVDVQRSAKKNIFDSEVTNLSTSVTSNQGHIPLTLSDLTKFPTMWHDTSYSDRPSKDVGYIEIQKEIIAHEGLFTHGVDGPSARVFADHTGTHDGAGNAAILTDSTASFVADALIGLIVENTTDGSQGVITDNTTTTITAALSGGTDDDWDVSDAYKVYTGRGALNTKAVEHTVDTTKSTDRRLKVTEHIFLAGAAPKVAHQVLTGHASENLCLQSEDMATSWTVTGSTVDTNISIAPDGNTTMDRLNVTTASSLHELTQAITTVSNEKHTVSVFVKADGERYAFLTFYQTTNNYITVIFDLENEEVTATQTETSTLSDYGIIPYDDDTYRLFCTGNLGAFTATDIMFGAAGDPEPASYSNGRPTFTGVAGEDLFFWGAQATNTNYIMPYVATTASVQSQRLLPENWSLLVSNNLIRTQDFTRLGNDLWNQFNDSGRHVRLQTTKRKDGKRFLEQELMFWMASFMPIYPNGQLGVKQLQPVLSDSAYVGVLDKFNVYKYSKLTHDDRAVVNQIDIDWNYVYEKGDFTKKTKYIDADSIGTHKEASEISFDLRIVHTATSTDEDILSQLDAFRDRYAGPPKRLTIIGLPSTNVYEVGDVVRVTLPQIADFNVETGEETTLDSAFEIQQKTMDWYTGRPKFDLFASSQKAGATVRSELSSVLDDSYYGYGGVHDGAGNAAVLTDTTESWTVNELVGLNIFNITDGSSSVITANTATTVTGVLSGGTDNDWDVSDIYSIGEGTDLRTVLTISSNQITVNGSLTGGAVMNDAIYYYLGNLTLNAGITLTIADNIFFRIQGDFTRNGTINGKGGGLPGAAGVSTFRNGATSATAPTLSGFPVGARIDSKPGTSGYLGNTKCMGGVHLRPYGGGYGRVYAGDDGVQSTDTITGSFRGISPIAGKVNALPYFAVVNGSTTLTGTPTTLRGTSGGGGMPVIYQASVTANREIVANGGAGGNGGAGFMIVCRGFSQGVAGTIDLSGDDGIVGSTYSFVGKTFYAGSGSGGYTGGLLILLDGNHTPPDITGSNFITANGDYPLVGTPILSARQVGQSSYAWSSYPISNWPFDPANGTSDTYDWFSPFPTQVHTKSAHGLQYIPESITIEEELNPPPPNVGNFTSTNDGLYALLEWDSLENNDVVFYEIRLGTTWSSATFLAKTDSTSYKYLMSSPDTYDFMVKAIDVDGTESLTATSISLVGDPTIDYRAQAAMTDGYSNSSFYWNAPYESLDNYVSLGATLNPSSDGITVTASTGTRFANRNIYRTIVDLSSFDTVMRFKTRALPNMASMLTSAINVRVGVSENFGFQFRWNSGTSKVDIYGAHTNGSSYYTGIIKSVNDATEVSLEAVMTPGQDIVFTVDASTATDTNAPLDGTDSMSGRVQDITVNATTGSGSMIIGEWIYLKDAS